MIIGVASEPYDLPFMLTSSQFVSGKFEWSTKHIIKFCFGDVGAKATSFPALGVKSSSIIRSLLESLISFSALHITVNKRWNPFLSE